MSPGRFLEKLVAPILQGDGREHGLGQLLTPFGHSAVVRHQRMAVIITRTRWICAFLSVQGLAWAAVDAIMLPQSAWLLLAIGRVPASVAEVVLALWRPRTHALDLHAYVVLGAAMLVLVLWEIFATAILVWLGVDRVPIAAFTSYFYEPFVIVTGLAIFPLTVLESGLLLIPSAIGFGVATLLWPAELGPISSVAALLRLSFVGTVGVIASAIQLDSFLVVTQQAARDMLTGLLNRKFGEEFMRAQLSGAARRHAPCTLLFLDLDRFKAINDQFGHEVGDHVLLEVARSLLTTFRSQDIVTRWGGEEFLVLLTDADSAGAVSAIKRLAARGLCRRPDGEAVTASIGVVQTPGGRELDFAGLVNCADARMYAGKQAGGNRYVLEEGAYPFSARVPAGADALGEDRPA